METALGEGGAGKRPVLIVLCGPSHCGKSTLAEALPGRVVSSDRVRESLGVGFSRSDSRVWDAFEKRKRAALESGGNVILDACHMSRRARKHAVQGADGFFKVLVVFDVKPSVLLARARWEQRVALEEVRRMAGAFERPTPEEAAELGFDLVLVITSNHFKEKERQVVKEIL